MLEKEQFNTILTYVIVIGLFILAFLIIKPIIYSIIFGALLGYIFYPVYLWILPKTKSKNASALSISIGLLILITLISLVIVGSLLKQAVDFSVYLKGVDFKETIKKTLPDFIFTSEASETVMQTIKSSLTAILEKFITKLGDFILNTPALLLHVFIVFSIFFFALRDGEEALEYFKSLTPFKKETQEKFFKHFKDITQSLLVGGIVIGVIQGLVTGAGYFIFAVPNALLLTLLTIIVGIIPLIGPPVVWIPVDIYLFAVGRTGAGVGLLIYGLIVINSVDTVLRPIIVSRKTQINSGIVLIGMIGGLFAFGVLGLLIGPLILAYILLIIEIYKKDRIGQDLIFKKAEPAP